MNGRATQQQAVLSVQTFQLANEAAVAVFHALAFVDNEIGPLVLLQMAAVDDAHFVGRDEHLWGSSRSRRTNVRKENMKMVDWKRKRERQLEVGKNQRG